MVWVVDDILNLVLDRVDRIEIAGVTQSFCVRIAHGFEASMDKAAVVYNSVGNKISFVVSGYIIDLPTVVRCFNTAHWH